MRFTTAILAITSSALVTGAVARTTDDRPEWSQERALETVETVLAAEQAETLRWDEIEWVLDPAEAASRAEREGRPILVYFFLRKDTGPALAPC